MDSGVWKQLGEADMARRQSAAAVMAHDTGQRVWRVAVLACLGVIGVTTRAARDAGDGGRSEQTTRARVDAAIGSTVRTERRRLWADESLHTEERTLGLKVLAIMEALLGQSGIDSLSMGEVNGPQHLLFFDGGSRGNPGQEGPVP